MFQFVSTLTDSVSYVWGEMTRSYWFWFVCGWAVAAVVYH